MITSTQNPHVKRLALLMEKSRQRRKEGVFVVEGVRELGIALQRGYHVAQLYYCPAILPNPWEVLPLLDPHVPVQELDTRVYAHLAYRNTTEGLIALLTPLPRTLDTLVLPENPLVIVLESVEKPGNLGAILRTADAVNAAAVLLCDPLTDLYNPNTIRASLGCLFSVPTFPCTSQEALSWLQLHNIQIVAANCQATRWHYQEDYTGPTAFVMGTEDKGLSPFWRQAATANIKIPMNGLIDSLNVSVATAVLCFEALRQRQINI